MPRDPVEPVATKTDTNDKLEPLVWGVAVAAGTTHVVVLEDEIPHVRCDECDDYCSADEAWTLADYILCDRCAWAVAHA